MDELKISELMNKTLTLPECKDQVAKKHGWDNWQQMKTALHDLHPNVHDDQAAELWNKSLIEENEKLKAQVDDLKFLLETERKHNLKTSNF